MSAHTLKSYPGLYGKRKPVAGSEHIDRTWAHTLRTNYRIMRIMGMRPSTARSVLHSGYHVGLNAGRMEAHERRMSEIRGAA